MAIHIKNDVAKLNEYAFLSFLSFSVIKLVAANCNIFFFGSTQSTLNIEVRFPSLVGSKLQTRSF